MELGEEERYAAAALFSLALHLTQARQFPVCGLERRTLPALGCQRQPLQSIGGSKRLFKASSLSQVQYGATQGEHNLPGAAAWG